MGKINVTKNTVVKNTPETFELIKALFKANGVGTERIDGVFAKAGSEYIGTDKRGKFCAGNCRGIDTEITLQELAFESLAAPELATMIVESSSGNLTWLAHTDAGEIVSGKWMHSGREFSSSHPYNWHVAKVILQKQPEKWMPDIGQECELEHPGLPGFAHANYVGTDRNGLHVFDLTRYALDDPYYSFQNPNCRPIKTDREKFIEAGMKAAGEFNPECDVTFLGAMFDAGFRVPENQG